MLKDISVSYDTVQFNGSFSHESIYRQVASPEVDEAWLALGAECTVHPSLHFAESRDLTKGVVADAAIIIPENEAEHYGIQRGQVKRPEEKGGGFFANVEVLHHLHCLLREQIQNLLRQTSHFDYDYYQKQGKGAFSNSQDVVRKHAGHCLDILRQHIMCTADIGVFGQWWVKGIGPFVDFNTKHKCKNFEEIRKWAEKRQIPDQEGYAKQRADDVVLDEIP
ncbi:hypothetical protein PRK78_003850 [Emydomyces testavorans]|uniref:Uncharacterized protein n=1 Tax=Emydomyces testavorans TaxID=2070801 RepID=A0AAF0DGZ2_9EURO|nr:hypothetical protein PRK78_003850 [Emydomyces testavorans]